MTECRKNIRTCAGGFLVESNRFLFGQRSSENKMYPSFWDIFGGHAEDGESPEETLSREFEEELGVIPTQFELFGVFDEPNPEKYGIAHHYIYFVTEWNGSNLRNCSKEHSDMHWFAREELNSLDLASREYLRMIDTWLRRKASILPVQQTSD